MKPETSHREALDHLPSEYEQRCQERYASVITAAYRFLGAGPDEPACPARLSDVSPRGIALVLERPLAPGRMLEIVLTIDQNRTLAVPPARVIYSSPYLHDLWRVGCEFQRELTRQELRSILWER